MTLPSHPNPALTVGADDKQGWNQPHQRRAGFHNAHLLFRRTLMVRSRRVLDLNALPDADIARQVASSGLTVHPAFSALVVAQGTTSLFEASAPDFAPDRVHSLQSISKMHIHLIIGELIADGHIHPDDRVGDLLPWIGSAYATARVQDVLDMNVDNDFSEDYSDPQADCFREEEALGWRLPQDDRPEQTLRDFVASLTGNGTMQTTGYARYKSANTDVLTLIAAGFVDLQSKIETIADAAGYEGAFHISLSPEHLPAFSGGGCLSARDLARFGLLFARKGCAVFGVPVGSADLLGTTMTHAGPFLGPKRGIIRYSNHLMTNGRWIGHAGYGGQFLMVDTRSGRVAAFLSVLENDSGYDDDYMASVIEVIQAICCRG
jgi:CubicO group peptidase (beta-lactamase class C family)